MTDQKIKKVLFFITLFLSVNLFCQTNRGYLRLKTGIHFDSNVSGGKYSLFELARIISRSGLDAAIITDHDNMKVTYGMAPFRNIIKYSIEENSISTYGVEKYLSEIKQIDELFKNTIIIPGVEAVPYYFWEGSPLNINLKLRNWHTHLLVFGLKDAEAYKKLPSIAKGIGYKIPSGNIMNYVTENSKHFLYVFILFLFFIISLLLVFRKRNARIPLQHIQRKHQRYRFSWTAFIFLLVFGVLLKFEYPFLPPLFDQHHGDQGSAPFQRIIDYVNENNALIFWAHPEVTHNERRPVNIPLFKQEISISTQAYPHLIVGTYDYSGFAIFWEGFTVIGKPHGLWDLVLQEYCSGVRSKPVWAISELDFEESNDLSLVKESLTFLFAKERSHEGVLEALRSGRMYATRNFAGDKMVLDEFSVYDMHTGQSAIIGETLNRSRPPTAIHIKLKILKPGNRPETIRLYRNSQMIKKYTTSKVLDEWYVDSEEIPEKMFYYRLLVGERWIVLATNPIFVNTGR